LMKVRRAALVLLVMVVMLAACTQPAANTSETMVSPSIPEFSPAAESPAAAIVATPATTDATGPDPSRKPRRSSEEGQRGRNDGHHEDGGS
jgi:ABC-type glycerol-3-phosphate transport system substrate-binding protein